MQPRIFNFTLKVWLTTIFCGPLLYILVYSLANEPEIPWIVHAIRFYIGECFGTALCTFLIALAFWIFCAIATHNVLNLRARLATILIIGFSFTAGTVLIFTYGWDENFDSGDFIKYLFSYCICSTWAMLYFKKQILVSDQD